MNLSSGFFILIFSCILPSCFQDTEYAEDKADQYAFKSVSIKYAKGFSVKHNNHETLLFIHDPNSGETLDTLNISGNEVGKIRTFKRIIAQSTTHFAFYQKNQVLNRLVGLCGIQYLSDGQQKMLEKTTEVCSANGLELEKIATLHPDLVFLYPFGDQDKINFRKLGIKTVFITEYLENSPLARAEWLKFFALISGQNPNETCFEEIEKAYLKNSAGQSKVAYSNTDRYKNQPVSKNQDAKYSVIPNSVLFNLPFGDTWDMPPGNSISSRLVEDAGLIYFFRTEKKNGNLLYKLEEAYNYLMQADYWVIIAARNAGFSRNDLLTENRIYENFPAVKRKHVFFCNSQTTPYFSLAPVEPEILLADLVNCVKGNDSGNKYFKILR